MCSTTPKASVAGPGVSKPSDIGDKTTARRIISLQQYLDKFYPIRRPALGPDFGTKTHVPISIYLQGKTGNHKYAGIFDREHHFSASIMKVAAMFAAFKLRKEARDLAVQVNNGSVTVTNANDFIAKLAAKFSLADAVDGIKTKPAVSKKPNYAQIITVTGFTNPRNLKVEFTSGFVSQMRLMIIPSNNCSAGECIHRIGYPYINVKLMEDNFFEKITWNTATPKGIWLAGDYVEAGCFNEADKLLYVRITTVNDCDGANFCGSAQNTCSKEMAEFFLQILEGKLVDSDASHEMFDLLRDAQQGPDKAFTGRGGITLLFNIEAVKIGQGPIKSDPQRGNIEVRSDGIIINWNILDDTEQKKWDDMNLTGNGAICWQNIPNNISLSGIAGLINDVISKFINQEAI